jgi:hypothetical protein
MPNKIFTSSSINKIELNNISLRDRYFDNICVSKENENIINSLETDKIIIILQINNKYMTVNGVKKEIDPGRGTVPVIIKGRSLVPIRAIIEELGGTVDWDGVERKVTIKFKDKTIELWIDKKVAKVNGTSKELDVPPMILNGRTMLPIRFVSENLGCEVKWDGSTQTVTITYDEPIKWETIKKIKVDSSGGTINVEDLNLSIPKNAFESTSNLVISKGEGSTPYGENILSKLYKVDGLPSIISKPIEVTLKLEKASKNETHVVFGEESFVPSLNKIDVNYQLLPSTVSGDEVMATIPPTESNGIIFKLLNQKLVSDTSSKKDGETNTYYLSSATNMKSEQSVKMKFKIICDTEILNKNFKTIQEILNYFEIAYTKLEDRVGLNWKLRTNWPINIEIKKLGQDTYGYFTASKLWRSRDYIQLNSDMLNNSDALTEFKVTAGHELFHLLQALYDPTWFLGWRGGPNLCFWEASSVWFEKLMIEKSDYCSKTLLDYSGKFMLNGLWNADNSTTGSAQDHGYGASMYLDYLINTYGNNTKIVGKIWENIKNGDSIFNSIKKALNVTFWYKNWENFINNYFSIYYNKCWNNTKGWILHKDVTERWTINDTEKDFQHEFKDNYYELSAKTKLIELRYEKKGFEKNEKPTMNFSISGTPNDIVACIFDYLNGKEIAYIDKVNSKDIDLSLYPKGTLFLVVIINNDFSGKTDTQEIILKVKITGPHIDSISPDSGNIGTTVTIKGRDFGKTQGTSKVIFSSNKIAPVSSWSDTEIKVKVPTGVVSGPVYVVVEDKKSNEVNFKIEEEEIKFFKRCEIILWFKYYSVNEKNETSINNRGGWTWPCSLGVDKKPIEPKITWSKNTLTALWEIEESTGYEVHTHVKGNMTVTFDEKMSNVISFRATEIVTSTKTAKLFLTHEHFINGTNIPIDPTKSYPSSGYITFALRGTETCSHISYKLTMETNFPEWEKLVKYECDDESSITIKLLH